MKNAFSENHIFTEYNLIIAFITTDMMIQALSLSGLSGAPPGIPGPVYSDSQCNFPRVQWAAWRGRQEMNATLI